MPSTSRPRLIALTSGDPEVALRSEQLRPDLYYALTSLVLRLPPLRERNEDILLLAEHFLSIYKKKYNKPNVQITPRTIKNFENYSWPGNVRELQHVIERSVILCDSNSIEPDDIYFNASNIKEELPDTFNLDEIEKKCIRRALLKFDGNISKAAKELGLTRTSLYRRIEKHGL